MDIGGEDKSAWGTIITQLVSSAETPHTQTSRITASTIEPKLPRRRRNTALLTLELEV
jgi:hypothetical protein